jgi:two-component system NtrC family response regulator
VSGDHDAVVPLREVRQRAETQAIQRALAVTSGNISKAAELLGITRPTLYDLMERAGHPVTRA